MDHTQATELFSAYWDEELEPAQASALEEHLRSCVVCRREYQAFERAVGALGNVDRATAPSGFSESVRRRIRKRSRGRFFAPRRLVDRIPYELFSLLMLGLILAIYVMLSLSHPQQLQLP